MNEGVAAGENMSKVNQPCKSASGAIISNPILPGFNPDPSALQVGDDYYIATSTFEWWPGVEIYHSTDLVNWEWVCNPLTRVSQADLNGNYNSGSIWAPHLSYAHGRYWLVYTDVKSTTQFKDTLNYIVSAPSIEGPWSEPVFVTASGFDPSLFHDDDGRSWFINMLFDWRQPDRERFIGTVIQEIDLDTMTLIGKRCHTFRGTSLGVCEGPHIVKRDGLYYLICAAGGTEYNHAATVVRSSSVLGPWEESPHTPLITTKDVPQWPLQKAGHCSAFLRRGDDWYVAFLTSRPLTERGNCTLGRETSLARIAWDKDGWPILANGTCHPDLELTIPGTNAVQRNDYSEFVHFSEHAFIPHTWKTLRMPLEQERDYSLTARPGWLRLYGGQSLSSLNRQTLFARRWQAFEFDAETELEFKPRNFQQTAGLVLFYDTQHWMYAFITADAENSESKYAQVLMNDHDVFTFCDDRIELMSGSRPVRLKAEVRGAKARFLLSEDDGVHWHILSGELPADHISDDHISAWRGKTVFTGAMVGICAQDYDRHTSFADFRYFDYKEIH